MRAFTKGILVAALAAAVALPALPSVQASAAEITTTATGYTKAEDVVYVKNENIIANWGARGEDCTFLSSKAEDFYTGSYTYDVLSQKAGGSGKDDAPSSALYSGLKSMMTAKHTHQTSYGETRGQYRYTDCVSSQYSNISSFYSGRTLSGDWDEAKTWNREHTWPNSKGLGGNDENDIMMLRPTSVQENSDRGNTAYGESGGFFDPGESTRGDCARIVLYVYVRWGNTSEMWGASGVMESVDVLLRWMAEDPVDTWEMGRNDSVQSITGTRNVFVDYPEYAWSLFGRSVPDEVTTPSGIAASGVGGSVGGGASDSSSTEQEETDECAHEFGKWFTIKAPTETEEGERERFCDKCGKSEKESLPKAAQSGSVLSGCTGTLYGGAGGVALAIACVFVLKKRKIFK